VERVDEMRGTWERGIGGYVCPLCATRRYHTRAEHRELYRTIRYPLQVELWGEDDFTIVARGHHQPARFLRCATSDDDVAWALDLADTDELTEDAVRHEWRRYAGKQDGTSMYKPAAGPGRGVFPVTLVDVP